MLDARVLEHVAFRVYGFQVLPVPSGSSEENPKDVEAMYECYSQSVNALQVYK